MKKSKNPLFFKIGAIVLITLLLLIPTSMIESLIYDRQTTRDAVVHEVSAKWGEEQTLTGPFIAIPYYAYEKISTGKDSAPTIVKVKKYIHVLPNQLSIGGKILPEKRYRGIYEIVVYNATLEIEGSFESLDFSILDIPQNEIMLDKAELVLGISDLRGIEEQVLLDWNNAHYTFESGVASNDVIKSGIHANVSLDLKDSSANRFKAKLMIKGSQKLYFTPVGKTTDVKVQSSWQNPSFAGAFLPDNRKITDSGFTAEWNVLNLNRNYPQIWLNDQYNLDGSAFGIDLYVPVDNYQKIYRSIRYAILFIGLTFLVFFFVEVLQKIFIHPIQYILVGIALIVFYSLLLSISEHLSFNSTYFIAAAATLGLIGTYVKAILKSTPLALMLTGILSILYIFIFVILQLQDYALLMGSIAVFVILGLVMYFSRKIDWSNLQINTKEQSLENGNSPV